MVNSRLLSLSTTRIARGNKSIIEEIPTYNSKGSAMGLKFTWIYSPGTNSFGTWVLWGNIFPTHSPMPLRLCSSLTTATRVKKSWQQILHPLARCDFLMVSLKSFISSKWEWVQKQASLYPKTRQNGMKKWIRLKKNY